MCFQLNWLSNNYRLSLYYQHTEVLLKFNQSILKYPVVYTEMPLSLRNHQRHVSLDSTFRHLPCSPPWWALPPESSCLSTRPLQNQLILSSNIVHENSFLLCLTPLLLQKTQQDCCGALCLDTYQEIIILASSCCIWSQI